jgi:hypothetical protein
MSYDVFALRFDFEGVDVPAVFKEFQDTEKRIKELKEKGGIQRQVRAQQATPVNMAVMLVLMGCAAAVMIWSCVL